MSTSDFTVEIKETSKEFTKRERVKMKDPGNALKIDELTTDGNLVIKPEAYCILSIHNPKSSDRPDYENIVILDASGAKYITGSVSFMRAFLEIWEEMDGETDWEIECYKRDSKNYKGKQFISCSVL